MRRSLGTSRTTLNVPTSESQGCHKEKGKNKKLKTYLKKIVEENFPNLIQEAQRVPNKMDPKRNIPRYIIIKLPKIKDKEKILKAAEKSS